MSSYLIKRLWSRSIWGKLLVAAIVSVISNGVIVLAEWYVVSPVGFGGISLLFLATPFGFPLLAAIFSAPLCLFALPFKKVRRQAVTILLCSTLYFLIAFPLIRLTDHIRTSAFHGLAERSSDLVAAIHRYHDEHGKPPPTLAALVPAYIPQVPGTGMPAYPKYEYSIGHGSGAWDGNPWVLYLYTSSGGFNFDMFMYFPLQNYPEYGYGGRLERINKWAYVHE